MKRTNNIEHESELNSEKGKHIINAQESANGELTETNQAMSGDLSSSPDRSDQDFQETSSSAPDLVCFSHLRWDFVFQRPQHLLTRCARTRRVFFIEEPIYDGEEMRLDVDRRETGITVVVPHLPAGEHSEEKINSMQREMVDRLFAEQEIKNYVCWYYTPMALAFSNHLKPLAVVYDCMDELSAFKGAPPALREREAELFKRADLVFTGGQSLYEAKREQHPHVHAFPSSIDVAHFAGAREISEDPVDQSEIAHPRLGFCGVIDERMDIELIDGIAEARPNWQLVMIGPVVKIDPDALPRRANIHYLGSKQYAELPGYLAGWDVALLPFARNESTRFISPTKTPEYLAAGLPVVSTSIRDVVRPYGQQEMVRIADTATEFVAAIEAAMNEKAETRQRKVDAFLAQTSWDRTWAQMSGLIEGAIDARRTSASAQAVKSSQAQAAAASNYALSE